MYLQEQEWWAVHHLVRPQRPRCDANAEVKVPQLCSHCRPFVSIEHQLYCVIIYYPYPTLP